MSTGVLLLIRTMLSVSSSEKREKIILAKTHDFFCAEIGTKKSLLGCVILGGYCYDQIHVIKVCQLEKKQCADVMRVG